MESGDPALTLDTPLEATGWVRPDRKLREGIAKLGIATVGDAILHFPRRHEDRTRFDRFPEGGMEQSVCLHVRVTDCRTLFGRGKGRRSFEAVVEPPGGDLLGNRLVLRWFNLPYLSKVLAAGQWLVIYGQPKENKRRVVIDHPDFEIVDDEDAGAAPHMGRIVPVYPLTAGVGQKPLRALIHRILESLPDEAIPEWLPPAARGGLSRAAAIRTLHYPETMADLEPARRRLALEEFTALQLELLRRRSELRARGGTGHCGSGRLLDRFLADLPFAPTSAQARAIAQVRDDLASPAPMVRLLQGDVGAGKTLVAAAAVLLAVESGCDAALMAPTHILAEQHFATFRDWFAPLGIGVRLLTGTRDEASELPLFANARRDGGPAGTLTIGTHALFHGRAGFGNGLGLVVIDEQHKFGVAQREALIGKGESVDVLVMTATPIPRTLTLACYGDLDVSILDELPAGRGKLITGIRLTSQTEAAAGFVRDQLAGGRQAYIVYPLIDESEKLAVGAATAAFAEWSERLAGKRVGLIHGRMTGEEKDRVMSAFRQGSVDALVTTTVIEVGVDVPNASTMLIYHAERFGLAQLHQLRGRVGRGGHKSYCVLLVDPEQAGARERLRILEETRDGFRIADEDLRLRGPGEVLGTMQSGLPDLRFADLLGDTRLVSEARRIAEEMIAGLTPASASPPGSRWIG
jgi:ATP-dependent DNA helicase RecG